jgi:hypothetical protein
MNNIHPFGRAEINLGSLQVFECSVPHLVAIACLIATYAAAGGSLKVTTIDCAGLSERQPVSSNHPKGPGRCFVYFFSHLQIQLATLCVVHISPPSQHFFGAVCKSDERVDPFSIDWGTGSIHQDWDAQCVGYVSVCRG